MSDQDLLRRQLLSALDYYKHLDKRIDLVFQDEVEARYDDPFGNDQTGEVDSRLLNLYREAPSFSSDPFRRIKDAGNLHKTLDALERALVFREAQGALHEFEINRLHDIRRIENRNTLDTAFQDQVGQYLTSTMEYFLLGPLDRRQNEFTAPYRSHGWLHELLGTANTQLNRYTTKFVRGLDGLPVITDPVVSRDPAAAWIRLLRMADSGSTINLGMFQLESIPMIGELELASDRIGPNGRLNVTLSSYRSVGSSGGSDITRQNLFTYFLLKTRTRGNIQFDSRTGTNKPIAHYKFLNVEDNNGNVQGYALGSANWTRGALGSIERDSRYFGSNSQSNLELVYLATPETLLKTNRMEKPDYDRLMVASKDLTKFINGQRDYVNNEFFASGKPYKERLLADLSKAARQATADTNVTMLVNIMSTSNDSPFHELKQHLNQIVARGGTVDILLDKLMIGDQTLAATGLDLNTIKEELRRQGLSDKVRLIDTLGRQVHAKGVWIRNQNDVSNWIGTSNLTPQGTMTNYEVNQRMHSGTDKGLLSSFQSMRDYHGFDVLEQVSISRDEESDKLFTGFFVTTPWSTRRGFKSNDAVEKLQQLLRAENIHSTISNAYGGSARVFNVDLGHGAQMGLEIQSDVAGEFWLPQYQKRVRGSVTFGWDSGRRAHIDMFTRSAEETMAAAIHMMNTYKDRLLVQNGEIYERIKAQMELAMGEGRVSSAMVVREIQKLQLRGELTTQIETRSRQMMRHLLANFDGNTLGEPIYRFNKHKYLAFSGMQGRSPIDFFGSPAQIGFDRLTRIEPTIDLFFQKPSGGYRHHHEKDPLTGMPTPDLPIIYSREIFNELPMTYLTRKDEKDILFFHIAMKNIWQIVARISTIGAAEGWSFAKMVDGKPVVVDKVINPFQPASSFDSQGNLVDPIKQYEYKMLIHQGPNLMSDIALMNPNAFKNLKLYRQQSLMLNLENIDGVKQSMQALQGVRQSGEHISMGQAYIQTRFGPRLVDIVQKNPADKLGGMGGESYIERVSMPRNPTDRRKWALTTVVQTVRDLVTGDRTMVGGKWVKVFSDAVGGIFAASSAAARPDLLAYYGIHTADDVAGITALSHQKVGEASLQTGAALLKSGFFSGVSVDWTKASKYLNSVIVDRLKDSIEQYRVHEVDFANTILYDMVRGNNAVRDLQGLLTEGQRIIRQRGALSAGDPRHQAAAALSYMLSQHIWQEHHIEHLRNNPNYKDPMGPMGEVLPQHMEYIRSTEFQYLTEKGLSKSEAISAMNIGFLSPMSLYTSVASHTTPISSRPTAQTLPYIDTTGNSRMYEILSGGELTEQQKAMLGVTGMFETGISYRVHKNGPRIGLLAGGKISALGIASMADWANLEDTKDSIGTITMTKLVRELTTDLHMYLARMRERPQQRDHYRRQIDSIFARAQRLLPQTQADALRLRQKYVDRLITLNESDTRQKIQANEARLTDTESFVKAAVGGDIGETYMVIPETVDMVRLSNGNIAIRGKTSMKMNIADIGLLDTLNSAGSGAGGVRYVQKAAQLATDLSAVFESVGRNEWTTITEDQLKAYNSLKLALGSYAESIALLHDSDATKFGYGGALRIQGRATTVVSSKYVPLGAIVLGDMLFKEQENDARSRLFKEMKRAGQSDILHNALMWMTHGESRSEYVRFRRDVRNASSTDYERLGTSLVEKMVNQVYTGKLEFRVTEGDKHRVWTMADWRESRMTQYKERVSDLASQGLDAKGFRREILTLAVDIGLSTSAVSSALRSGTPMGSIKSVSKAFNMRDSDDMGKKFGWKEMPSMDRGSAMALVNEFAQLTMLGDQDGDMDAILSINEIKALEYRSFSIKRKLKQSSSMTRDEILGLREQYTQAQKDLKHIKRTVRSSRTGEDIVRFASRLGNKKELLQTFINSNARVRDEILNESIRTVQQSRELHGHLRGFGKDYMDNLAAAKEQGFTGDDLREEATRRTLTNTKLTDMTIQGSPFNKEQMSFLIKYIGFAQNIAVGKVFNPLYSAVTSLQSMGGISESSRQAFAGMTSLFAQASRDAFKPKNASTIDDLMKVAKDNAWDANRAAEANIIGIDSMSLLSELTRGSIGPTERITGMANIKTLAQETAVGLVDPVSGVYKPYETIKQYMRVTARDMTRYHMGNLFDMSKDGISAQLPASVVREYAYRMGLDIGSFEGVANSRIEKAFNTHVLSDYTTNSVVLQGLLDSHNMRDVHLMWANKADAALIDRHRSARDQFFNRQLDKMSRGQVMDPMDEGLDRFVGTNMVNLDRYIQQRQRMNGYRELVAKRIALGQMGMISGYDTEVRMMAINEIRSRPDKSGNHPRELMTIVQDLAQHVSKDIDWTMSDVALKGRIDQERRNLNATDRGAGNIGNILAEILGTHEYRRMLGSESGVDLMTQVFNREGGTWHATGHESLALSMGLLDANDTSLNREEADYKARAEAQLELLKDVFGIDRTVLPNDYAGIRLASWLDPHRNPGRFAMTSGVVGGIAGGIATAMVTPGDKVEALGGALVMGLAMINPYSAYGMIVGGDSQVGLGVGLGMAAGVGMEKLVSGLLPERMGVGTKSLIGGGLFGSIAGAVVSLWIGARGVFGIGGSGDATDTRGEEDGGSDEDLDEWDFGDGVGLWESDGSKVERFEDEYGALVA